MQKSGKSMKFVVFLVIVIVIVVFVWLWKNQSSSLSASSDSYQAVFLSNNQVYFGKLTNLRSQYPVLNDVFYINVTQIQPRVKDQQPFQSVSLVKLGGEIHGPEDSMVLNRDQILFFENLTSGSQVVKSILQYKEGQAKK